MISSAMYEVLPRGASPRCAPPAKRRSARKAGPRIGGQCRPAPRSAAAAPARPHAYYISPFTLCQAPFFGFISRAFPDLLRPFMAFPCPFAAFFAPFCRAAGAAAGGQNGCGKAGRGQRSKANPEKTAAARNGPRSRERGSAEKTRRRAAETPSPPPLPQSAGAQTRRAGAYT